jgi:hypothetical protein
VKSGILYAISLASVVLSHARGRAAGRRRLRAQLEEATTEVSLLREELSIKDGRWERSRSRRRPHYTAVQRMRILQLRAARGWTLEKTVRVFLVDLHTLQIWMRRLDEHGERDVIQTVEPVNRYPDFVRNLVRQVKRLLPTMGCERMAQVLARAGLVLGVITIRRMIREHGEPPEDDVAVDQVSRVLVGYAVFSQAPTSSQVQTYLDCARRVNGSTPRYVITDKGKQFWCRSFNRWAKRRGIRPGLGLRFRAHHAANASVAIVKRTLCFAIMGGPRTVRFANSQV